MIKEYFIPITSANKPCNGGSNAPPTIIIISMEEAEAVCLPKPSIDRVNTFPHIIELKRPIAKIHQTAICGADMKEEIIRPKLTIANIPKLNAGIPFPK